MDSEELLFISVIIVVLLLIMVWVSNRYNNKHHLTTDELYLLDHTNMRHTNLDGKRMHAQRLPPLGASQFMSARYKVIADDTVGDNVEPMSDLIIAGFKNPSFEHGRQKELPDVSQTYWSTQKSSPSIAYDDKQFEHIAAELVTPGHRVEMSKKVAHFLPHTGGRSRLNFSSFENSNNEAAFRQ